MVLTARRLTMVAMMKIEFPTRTVRLCDGGFIDFDSGSGAERYLSRDAVFGTVADMEAIEDEMGDIAPGTSFALFPSPTADLADIFYPAMQGSRVRRWWGEVDSDMKTVSTAELLADELINVPTWNPDAWRLDFQMMGRGHRLFLRNEGNVCSSSSHQRFWPGERGFDNCTDTPGQVAWGTESPPSSNIYAGAGGGVTVPRGGGVGDGINRGVRLV
jgi:hypothetical protein